MNALIVVDVIKDFLPGGNLPVPMGDTIVEFINSISKNYDIVVATNDFHPKTHKSFKENGGEWSSHCVRGTVGCEFADGLNTENYIIVEKGIDQNAESYSGFEDEYGVETTLKSILQENNVDTVDIVGLALDYCVSATAIDAVKYGFKTRVLLDGCRGFAATDEVVAKLKSFDIESI